jgi:hypothetical protein
MKDLLQLQIDQLERLTETKRLTFRNAHYVIFSDYPSESFYNLLMSTEGLRIGAVLLSKFRCELNIH